MATYDTVPPPRIVYPESDGEPMADNTLQFRWIVTIEGGIDTLFKDDPNVFVAGDLLWYPVEGHPEIRVAPDILVAFGRPKGERGSYQQWNEGNIAPQVVFEILSPGNRITEMTRKFWFYDKYGADEYYIYDPDTVELSGWRREEGELVEITTMDGWLSPRLGVRFAIEEGELRLYRPDGRRFATYVELAREAELAQQQAELAQQQAEHERRERERAQQHADRLAAQLRALGIEPDQG
jgi:Uma2 family endonuclease